MDIKMRTSVFCLFTACIMTLSFPLVSELTYGGRYQTPDNIPSGDDTVLEDEYENEESTPPELNEEVTENITPSTPNVKYEFDGRPIRVLDAKTGKVSEMALDDYITCVVAAEMPYSFNSEALKAQAVAARSYCMYKIENGSGHEDGDVCTSYSHCAAFVTEETLNKKYGSAITKKILQKVGAAVKATSGEIITYEGKPALALFHSRSWQKTESSENVWGGKLPYLVSVSTPEADSISTVTVTDKELKKCFASDSAIKVSVSDSNGNILSEMNDSGRQAFLYCNGSRIKAKTLRSLLGLRSCSFEFERVGDDWVFTVHGYGHGVGMSQYGANEMAKQGSTYSDILTHYYSGIQIENIYE